MNRSLVIRVVLLLLTLQLTAVCATDSIEQAVLVSDCNCLAPIEDQVLMNVDACSMTDCISPILLDMGVHMAPFAPFEYNTIFEGKEEAADFLPCLTRTFTGETINESRYDDTEEEVDIRCASWFEHVWDGIKPILAASFAAFQDNISVPAFYNGGISEVALTSFPGWLLDSYSAGQLASMGIDDLGSFDVIEYLLRRELSDSAEAAPEDPIWRALVMYDFETNLETWGAIQDRAAQLGHDAERETHLFGNQGQMWASSYCSPYSVALSQYNPIVQIEHVVYTSPLPPFAHSSLVSKVGRASATNGQPVWVCGIIYDWENDEPYFSRDLARLAVSEAYANGTRRVIELVLAGPRGDIQLPADMYSGLVDIGRWINRYGLFESPGQSMADVALVYSMPSLMWRFYPPTGHSNWQQTYEFSGWSRILEEEHIPHDVLVFGHPDVWDDGDLEATLSSYSTVIFPMVDCISDAQLAALDSYISAGGTVITSGDFANRTENFIERGSSDELRLQTVPYSGELDAQKYYMELQNLKIAIAEREALTSFLSTSVGDRSKIISDVGPNVAVNLLRDTDGNLQAHLVNYDYAAASRQSISQPGFSISIPMEADELDAVSSVHLFTPDQEDALLLPFAVAAGRIIIDAPGIDIYSVLVIGNYDLRGRVLERNEELLDLLTDEAEQVYKADLERIQELIDLGRWREALIVCEDLQAEYRLLPNAPITIGVDQGHENQTSLAVERSAQFYPQNPAWYHLSLLENLGAQAVETPIQIGNLEGLDILVVPAGWEELTAMEIEAIQTYVYSGGSLLLIGTCFVDSGNQELAEAFDIDSMNACIGALSEGGYIARRSYDHWITEQIAAVWPRAAAHIVLGEEWSMLMETDAEVYADQNDSESREAGEPEGSFPFLAVRSYGMGRVAVVADHTLFSTASTTQGGAIAERLIRWLAGTDGGL